MIEEVPVFAKFYVIRNHFTCVLRCFFN